MKTESFEKVFFTGPVGENLFETCNWRLCSTYQEKPRVHGEHEWRSHQDFEKAQVCEKFQSVPYID